MDFVSIKAVFFDVGGVVVKSPLIAIHNYEQEKGLPKDYLNLQIIRRGNTGAWQRFERGEMELFDFYAGFGTELSDLNKGNPWYREWCESRGVECPPLPESLHVDGREIFGQMMRSSTTFEPLFLSAISRIRETNQYRIVALTNNFSAPYEQIRSTLTSAGYDPSLPTSNHNFSSEEELNFLGWGGETGGPAGPRLRGLFDDFVDSSIVGRRKPEPEIYLYACERNNVQPEHVVFLDDLGLNLRAAKQLGMKTIHVPIGGSRLAIEQLQEILRLQLLDDEAEDSRLGLSRGTGVKL